MPEFVIAQLAEGRVKTSDWWYPRPGQRVYLYRRGDDLIVDYEPCGFDCVPYTWPRPRGRILTPSDQAVLAWRHYDRAMRNS
jgi:hypothetical protein